MWRYIESTLVGGTMDKDGTRLRFRLCVRLLQAVSNETLSAVMDEHIRRWLPFRKRCGVLDEETVVEPFCEIADAVLRERRARAGLVASEFVRLRLGDIRHALSWRRERRRQRS